MIFGLQRIFQPWFVSNWPKKLGLVCKSRFSEKILNARNVFKLHLFCLSLLSSRSTMSSSFAQQSRTRRWDGCCGSRCGHTESYICRALPSKIKIWSEQSEFVRAKWDNIDYSILLGLENTKLSGLFLFSEFFLLSGQLRDKFQSLSNFFR